MKWSEAIKHRKRFDTPTRILREFVAEAEDTYKLGFLTDEPEAVDLAATMYQFKDEWDLKVNDLYNEEAKVQYNCYLDHVASTICAQLNYKHDADIDIDLREGFNTTGKTQITVTTVHQSKHSTTKLGDEYGYGKDTKKTTEDKILESVICKATPKYRNAIHFEGQEETLAAFVPDVPKKAAKPVDAQTALTLSCRRGQLVDLNGVPQYGADSNALSIRYEDGQQMNQGAAGAFSPKVNNKPPTLFKDSMFAQNNELSIAYLPKNTHTEVASQRSASKRSTRSPYPKLSHPTASSYRKNRADRRSPA